MSSARLPGPLGAQSWPWQQTVEAGSGVLRLGAPPAPVGTGTVLRSRASPIEPEVRLLAAVAYGEASTGNVYEEMAAIANVLARQRAARGYADMRSFMSTDRDFAYAAHDGNRRFRRFQRASADDIAADPGMSAALRAARNALSPAGIDYSNGAYFWDGADIRSNYEGHSKVQRGIRFSDPAHNIYAIQEKDVPKEHWLTNAAGQKIRLRGRWDYVYESTAAYGGTIFWRLNPDFVQATGNRVHQ